LREERRLRVFENRVLRKIFRPKREEVRGEWKELHNEELNNLYFSPNIIHYQIRKNEMGRGSSAYEGDKSCIQGFVGKPEGKRPFARPAPRLEDYIRVDPEDGRTWATLVWFRTGKCGGPL
jgi:hypothetical protein